MGQRRIGHVKTQSMNTRNSRIVHTATAVSTATHPTNEEVPVPVKAYGCSIHSSMDCSKLVGAENSMQASNAVPNRLRRDKPVVKVSVNEYVHPCNQFPTFWHEHEIEQVKQLKVNNLCKRFMRQFDQWFFNSFAVNRADRFAKCYPDANDPEINEKGR